MTLPPQPQSNRAARLTPGDSGFSLMELLVALSLLAIILVILVGALDTSRRTWQRTAAMDAVASDDVVRGLLRDLLTRAEPAAVLDTKGQLQLSFLGGTDQLDFVTTFAGRTLRGGLYRARLTLRDGGLNLTLTPYRPYATREVPPADERDLLTDVKTLKLRYYGSLDSGTGASSEPGWHDAWRGASRLPQLLEITIERGPSARPWRDLLVAPALR